MDWNKAERDENGCVFCGVWCKHYKNINNQINSCEEGVFTVRFNICPVWAGEFVAIASDTIKTLEKAYDENWWDIDWSDLEKMIGDC
jgi:hypothetical protein